MRGIEVPYAKSTIFRDAVEYLVDLVEAMVPDTQELRHISIDVKKQELIVMTEEVKDG